MKYNFIKNEILQNKRLFELINKKILEYIKQNIDNEIDLIRRKKSENERLLAYKKRANEYFKWNNDSAVG